MSGFLFDDLPEAAAPVRQEKCGQCEHLQRWRNGQVSESHRVNFYCGIRKSRRTENGLLKTKRKNTACGLFLKGDE